MCHKHVNFMLINLFIINSCNGIKCKSTLCFWYSFLGSRKNGDSSQVEMNTRNHEEFVPFKLRATPHLMRICRLSVCLNILRRGVHAYYSCACRNHVTVIYIYVHLLVSYTHTMHKHLKISVLNKIKFSM